VAGGEHKRLDMWAAPDSPPWYAGQFWGEPGQYRLRLIADDGLADHDPGDQALTLREPFLKDTVVSNEADLTIDVPKGADAQVYQLIKADGTWMWPDHLAQRVWQLYPGSEYTAYMVRGVHPPDAAKDLASFEASLSRKPRGAFPDYYRLAMARDHIALAYEFLRTDLSKALREVQTARSLLAQISDHDTDPAVQKEAGETLAGVKTTLQLLEDFGALHGVEVQRQKIIPLVQCVSVDGKNLRVTLGYDNPNKFPLQLEAGFMNQFEPSPMDRGQPTLFLAGRHEGAFKIKASSTAVLTWTLDDSQTTFPTLTTPKCRSDN
jgi:hypothetical protein